MCTDCSTFSANVLIDTEPDDACAAAACSLCESFVQHRLNKSLEVLDMSHIALTPPSAALIIEGIARSRFGYPNRF